MKRAVAEMKTRSLIVCQSWKQADEGALVYPNMTINSKILFLLPMYWSACVGYVLKNEKGDIYTQYKLVQTDTPYRLKNISDTFTDVMYSMEGETNKKHIIGQFYALRTGNKRSFTQPLVEKLITFMGADEGPARWEEPYEAL